MLSKKLVLIALVIIATALLLLILPMQRSASLQKQLNFTIGICTHGNASSELYAISNGIKYFRTDISLNPIEKQLLNYEHTKGAEYLGILDYNTLPNGISNKDWNLSTWNESVANAVKEYPWIDTWEIWNEPWASNFQTGYMNGSAYNYYEVIKGAYMAIKSAEPNATIVCFGGAPIANYPIYLWYSQVWSYGASSYCNAISIHAYPSSFSFSQYELSWASSLNEYELLTGKPIWITEFGMPASSNLSQGYTQEIQGKFMEQALSFFSNYSYIKKVYWYDLWGFSDGAYGNNFGLLNISNPASGKPNAAWSIFLNAYNESNMH
jgi:hypothetical protein